MGGILFIGMFVAILYKGDFFVFNIRTVIAINDFIFNLIYFKKESLLRDSFFEWFNKKHK